MKAQVLKAYMAERKLKPADVAQYLDRAESTVKSYMRGSTPDLNTCRALCRLFRCKLEDLLYSDEIVRMGVSSQEARVTA